MVHFFFYFVILHVILNVSCGLTGINLDFRLPIKLSKLDLSRNIKTSFPFEKIRYCRGGRSVSNRGVTLSGSRSLSNRYYNNIMNGIKPTNVWSKISEYSMNVYDICTFELHPVSSIVNYYNSLPVVTQSIMVLSVLSTLIFSFLTNIIKSIDINIVRNIGKEVGIDSIASLSFDMIPMEFFRILQIASTFLFFGPISMRLVYNLYFITKYASNLEYELEKRFHDKSKILTVLMSSQLIYNSLLSSFTGLTHIGQSTLSALMYAYSTITDPEEEMRMLFGVVIKAKQLPFFIMAFDCLMKRSALAMIPHAIGILSAYLTNKSLILPSLLSDCMEMVLTSLGLQIDSSSNSIIDQLREAHMYFNRNTEKKNRIKLDEKVQNENKKSVAQTRILGSLKVK